MKTKVVTTNDEFINLKEGWERLQECDTDASYYNTYIYNKTWWDIYQNDNKKRLFIICVYNNDELVGIAPFIIETKNKKVIKYNILRFLGIGDYLNVLLNKKDKNEFTIIKEIFSEIEKNNNMYERVLLTNISHKSMLAAYLLKNEKYNKSFKCLEECPIIDFTQIESRDIYIKYFVPAKTNKYKNKLDKELGYKFKIINGCDDYTYEEITSIHKKEQNYLVSSRGRKERRSLFNDKLKYDFIKKLYKNNKNVTIFAIEDDKNNIISYNFCYFYKGIIHSWNSGYDPDFNNYNLNKVRIYELINYLFQNSFHGIFDFGSGRYSWKFEWANNFIFNYQLDMWSRKTNKGIALNKLFNIKNKVITG